MQTRKALQKFRKRALAWHAEGVESEQCEPDLLDTFHDLTVDLFGALMGVIEEAGTTENELEVDGPTDSELSELAEGLGEEIEDSWRSLLPEDREGRPLFETVSGVLVELADLMEDDPDDASLQAINSMIDDLLNPQW